MNKIKTLCKIGLVSIAFLLLLVSSTTLAATEKNASPTITETQITNSGSAYSPDIYGDKIVWEDRRTEETGDIYMYDLSTKKETQISTQGYASNPAIYGNRIVWEDWGGEECNIYMYDLTTKKTTQISTSGSAYNPSIYGDRILWHDSRNGSEIYIYDLTNKKETQVISGGSEYYDIYADRIVYSGYSDGIFVYDLSTKKEAQITTSGTVYQPAIYGNRIVWEDTRSGNYDIYMYDLSTKKQTQITSSPDDQKSPVIYGNRILWEDVGGKDDGWHHHGIYMYDISTNQKMKIAASEPASDPKIYGNRIVYSDDRNIDSDIYMSTISSVEPQPKLPVAAFSASPRSGKAPLKVQFTDKSANSPTSWKWSFGDGTYSTAKNPAHTYSKAGKYTVSLTVKNTKGSNTKKVSGYIVASKK